MAITGVISGTAICAFDPLGNGYEALCACCQSISDAWTSDKVDAGVFCHNRKLKSGS